MALQANLQRNIEEHTLHVVPVILSKFDPAVAIVRREVRRIHIVERTPRNQSCFQHRSQVGKHEILKTLLLRIIEKKFAQQIAREGMNVVALEP